MKKIIVVGGGITGCAIAYHLKKQNYRVEIYEKSDQLGGILKDVTFLKDDVSKKFLNGPQYIDETKWSREIFLNKNFESCLKKINYKYGSFTDLFDKKKPTILQNYALPATKCAFKGIKKLKKNSDLLNRFNCYQNNISNNLIKWAKNYYINLNELHYGSCLPIQTRRIFFVNDKKKIQELKKNNKIADDFSLRS